MTIANYIQLNGQMVKLESLYACPRLPGSQRRSFGRRPRPVRGRRNVQLRHACNPLT
jgi:hypothetical protein